MTVNAPKPIASLKSAPLSAGYLAPHAAVLDAICRVDFVSFVRRCFDSLAPTSQFINNWHIQALAFDLSPETSSKNG
jgi:hypothetical protein